jgi:hypothetical protein
MVHEVRMDTLLPRWRWGSLGSKWLLRCIVICQMRKRLRCGTVFRGNRHHCTFTGCIGSWIPAMSSSTPILSKRYFESALFLPGLHLPPELWGPEIGSENVESAEWIRSSGWLNSELVHRMNTESHVLATSKHLGDTRKTSQTEVDSLRQLLHAMLFRSLSPTGSFTGEMARLTYARG